MKGRKIVWGGALCLLLMIGIVGCEFFGRERSIAPTSPGNTVGQANYYTSRGVLGNNQIGVNVHRGEIDLNLPAWDWWWKVTYTIKEKPWTVYLKPDLSDIDLEQVYDPRCWLDPVTTSPDLYECPSSLIFIGTTFSDPVDADARDRDYVDDLFVEPMRVTVGFMFKSPSSLKNVIYREWENPEVIFEPIGDPIQVIINGQVNTAAGIVEMDHNLVHPQNN